MTVHPLDPVFDQNARVLILGSFPSVRSREVGFYYGHPQNRFWKVLAAVCDAPVPASIDEKKAFLLANGIALWDAAYRGALSQRQDGRSVLQAVSCRKDRAARGRAAVHLARERRVFA